MLVPANALDGQSGDRVVAGMRIEVPAVSYKTIGRGDSWDAIADQYLGSKKRGEALAMANGTWPWVPPDAGREILIPFNLRYVVKPGDSTPSIAYRFLEKRDDAYVIDRYNELGGEPVESGDVILVPLSDLALTDEGKRAAREGLSYVAKEGEGDDRDAQDAAVREIPDVERDVAAGHYIAAIAAGSSLLGSGKLTDAEIARIERQLVEAFVAEGALDLAEDACRAWRRAAPGVDHRSRRAVAEDRRSLHAGARCDAARATVASGLGAPRCQHCAMTESLAPVSSPLREGDIVGEKYRVGDPIGSGATGVVYRATKLADGAKLALKVIDRAHCGDKQIFGRYHREAKILQRLSGPHLVALLDFVEHDGLLAIALELVDGAPLDAVIPKRLEIPQAIEIVTQIADGLGVAHAAGVVHRDLKPANVMIEPRGWPTEEGESAPRVRILDFGLAKVVHGDQMTTGLTEHGMIFGTPEYMSPEQARGDEIDGRCDVYAAGIMLYEMATGRVPFSRKTPLATMTAQLTEPVAPPREVAPGRDIPAALEAVIMRALAKEPRERYPSAAAFADALRAVREKRALSIAPSRDTNDLELGETDLAIRLSQVSPERKPSIEARSARVAPGASVPPVVSDRGSGVWIIVGVVVALIAVAVGAALAFR